MSPLFERNQAGLMVCNKISFYFHIEESLLVLSNKPQIRTPLEANSQDCRGIFESFDAKKTLSAISWAEIRDSQRLINKLINRGRLCLLNKVMLNYP